MTFFTFVFCWNFFKSLQLICQCYGCIPLNVVSHVLADQRATGSLGRMGRMNLGCGIVQATGGLSSAAYGVCYFRR